MIGSGLNRVIGALLGMLIVPPPAALAFRIAWRREPAPVSLVLVTGNVPSARQESAAAAKVIAAAAISDAYCRVGVIEPLRFRVGSWRIDAGGSGRRNR